MLRGADSLEDYPTGSIGPWYGHHHGEMGSWKTGYQNETTLVVQP
jgi:hypothetical protein